MAMANTGIESNRTSRCRSVPGIRILGTGYGLADQCVPNDKLGTPGCDSEWIIQRTGIHSRYHASATQATSDLAIAAGRQCLERAGVSPLDLDLIIISTMTPDYYTPPTACLVQAALGAQCGAIDMNVACSGFIYGLVTASQFINSGSCNKVLVIGADKMSMVIDPNDPRTWPLFGDGAGAALIGGDQSDHNGDEAAINPGLLAWRLGSEGELGGSLVVPAGGSRRPATIEALNEREQYLKMEGRSVFKWAVRQVPEIVTGLAEDAGVDVRDVDVFLLHQANRRIIDAAAEQMGIDSDKVFVNVDRFGNTSAGSVPILMHECVRDGHIHPGQLVMAVGFGAGLTWGGCLLRW
jgi:3-oxoacyl-[acyl-carrier-protein] synthase-3